MTVNNIESVNLDQDGYINIDYYLNAAIDIMNRGAEERGQNPRGLNSNDAFALYRRVYDALFRPEGGGKGSGNLFERGCNVDYNAENFSRLLNIYATLCIEYDSLPSAEGVEWLTGIHISTFEKYVTGARLFVQNIRKNAIQNKLQSFPIGVVTLANNDIETGLCYNRQNITDRAAVSKALDFNELVKIGEKTGNVSRLDDTKPQDIVDTDE